jgi:hypothetical protein
MAKYEQIYEKTLILDDNIMRELRKVLMSGVKGPLIGHR